MEMRTRQVSPIAFLSAIANRDQARPIEKVKALLLFAGREIATPEVASIGPAAEIAEQPSPFLHNPARLRERKGHMDFRNR
jgi:hypothetical protein